MDVAVLFSGGKDSVYALYEAQNDKTVNVKTLVTIISENSDSYMFHTPNIKWAEFQAKALGLPILIKSTPGEKEKELKDLENALKQAQDKYKIKGLYAGALFSEYQKKRVHDICKKLRLKLFSPFWNKDPEEYMKDVISLFDALIIKVSAECLNRDFLGKRIDKKILEKLKEINKENNININGEGGEFETFVVDGKNFRKTIEIKKSHIMMESENTGVFLIDDIILINK